jgi:FkbM family methyltransferase
MKRFLKQAIKQTFHYLGFELHRRDKLKVPLRRTLSDMLDHFIKLKFLPNTVIDVGVAYGTFDLYEKFPGARLLLVEPLEEYKQILGGVSRKYRAEYVLAAAGAMPGTTTLNVHHDLSGSSLFKEAEGNGVDGVPRQVPMVTIDDLCNERNLLGPYLIKADVQGAELSVLDGGKRVLEDTEVLILEVSLFHSFRNGPQFYDVVTYMNDRGFVVYDIFSGRNRPLDGALAQVDMVFVKENGQFRTSHSFATPEQRQQVTKLLISRNPKG